MVLEALPMANSLVNGVLYHQHDMLSERGVVLLIHHGPWYFHQRMSACFTFLTCTGTTWTHVSMYVCMDVCMCIYLYTLDIIRHQYNYCRHSDTHIYIYI